jgi:DNA-directed RNA polymerase II subunit RPB2
MQNIQQQLIGEQVPFSQGLGGFPGPPQAEDAAHPILDPNGPITTDDAWTVIKAYFSQHGLVKQQIDSFDRFLKINVQDIVLESGEIQIESVP